MAKYQIDGTTLTDIGDAIRSKTGGSALIYAEDMADAIESIPSGGGGGQSSFSFQADVSGSWNESAGGERSMLTITATDDTTISFGTGSTGRTNCSNNDGYIEIRKNGVSVHHLTLTTNATVALGTIPDISLSAGDVCEVIFGFAGSHTNINMHLYDGEIQIDGGAAIVGSSAYSNSTVTLK